jgi:hypothetical protein
VDQAARQILPKDQEKEEVGQTEFAERESSKFYCFGPQLLKERSE